MVNKDPGKKHFYISMVKSAVRILAGVALMGSHWQAAGFLFISAEVLGILEEF